MKKLRPIFALAFLLGLSIPVQANPFVKTGHAITHAVKAVGHGFMKMLSGTQWPTER